MTTDRNKNPPTYFDNLDALRGIASLAVVFFHIPSFLVIEKSDYVFKIISIIFSYNGEGGKLGVYFFFTLSGFLITYLLFLEKHTNGKINILNFYIRRFLRIWPLYYLVIFIGFFVSPFLCDLMSIEYAEHARLNYYLLFLSNFDIISNNIPVNKVLGTVWSVAIEEQFYLFWPLIFIFLKRKLLLVLFVFLLFFAGLFNVHFFSSSLISYYHTISCVLYLASGAIIAYFAFHRYNDLVKKVSFISPQINLLIYIFSLTLLFFTKEVGSIFDDWLWISKILASVFFCYVILDQTLSTRSFFKFGRLKILNFTGKLSYGVYLLHMIAIYLVLYLANSYQVNPIFQIALVFIITYCLSFLSFNYFERPFIKLKSKFSFHKIVS